MIIPAPIGLAQCDCGEIIRAGFRINLELGKIQYLTSQTIYAAHQNKGHEITWLKNGSVTFV